MKNNKKAFTNTGNSALSAQKAANSTEPAPERISPWRKLKTGRAGIKLADAITSSSGVKSGGRWLPHTRCKENRIGRHYEYNTQFKFSGYLNGQGVGELSGLKYGLRTFKDDGCGPIAVYNAMLALGDHMSIQDIIRHCETDGVMAGGYFGTSPIAIDEFFKNRGYTAKTYFGAKVSSKRDYDRIFEDHTAAIFAFYHGPALFKGSHFVAIVHNDAGGIDVYNYRNDSTGKRHFSSIEELINDDKDRIPLSITVIR